MIKKSATQSFADTLQQKRSRAPKVPDRTAQSIDFPAEGVTWRSPVEPLPSESSPIYNRSRKQSAPNHSMLSWESAFPLAGSPLPSPSLLPHCRAPTPVMKLTPSPYPTGRRSPQPDPLSLSGLFGDPADILLGWGPTPSSEGPPCPDPPPRSPSPMLIPTGLMTQSRTSAFSPEMRPLRASADSLDSILLRERRGKGTIGAVSNFLRP